MCLTHVADHVLFCLLYVRDYWRPFNTCSAPIVVIFIHQMLGYFMLGYFMIYTRICWSSNPGPFTLIMLQNNVLTEPCI